LKRKKKRWRRSLKIGREGIRMKRGAWQGHRWTHPGGQTWLAKESKDNLAFRLQPISSPVFIHIWTLKWSFASIIATFRRCEN